MISAQKIHTLLEGNITDNADYKVGSASLDVRLGDLINSYTLESHTLGDHIDDNNFKQEKFTTYALNPKESIIVSIKEKFDFPKNITGLLIPRGSILKIGLSFPVNFINAGYKCNMSVLITNQSNMIINIPAGILIGQVLFFDLKEDSEQPYAEDDKYYNEMSDKSKLDLDQDLESVYKKVFPSMYK